jgi:transketolase
VHGNPLGADEIAAAREYLGWTAAPFDVPDDILADWRSLGAKGAEANRAWRARRDASAQRGAFESRFEPVGERATAIMAQYAATLAQDPPKVASRKASEMALGPLTENLPQLIGGSADLTGSNNTKTSATTPFTRDTYSGRYLYYGIREFGMASAMNGMALHGGVLPYGGTFLIFSDYCRNAIRLSALQQVQVVYVLTHDSIGLARTARRTSRSSKS